MPVQALDYESFTTTVKEPGIVLVDFWADWCRPCKMFAPIYEAASEKHPDLTFTSVDTEAQQELAADANLEGVPTLMVFKDGTLVYNEAGALPGPALEQLIEAARDLDLDKAKQEAAAQE